jgi:hypothetical protein
MGNQEWTRHGKKTNKAKYTMQKTKKMSKPDHTKNPGVNPRRLNI